MVFSVMTFNLRMNTSDDGENAWPYRKDKAAQVIKDHEPLLIGIQEGFHSMLVDIEAAVPHYAIIGEGREGGKKDEYSAILYDKDKLDLIEHDQFWLSETPEVVGSSSWESACPRICTWARFKLKDDQSQEILAFNTHLDHVSQEAREKGIELILEKAKKDIAANVPVILTGDFNVEPTNPVVNQIEEAGLLRIKTEGRTFHNFKGGREGEPIDYIFTSKAIQVKESEVERAAFDGVYPSDHYPVVARLSI